MIFPHILTFEDLDGVSDIIRGYKSSLEFVNKNVQMPMEKRSWYANQIFLREKARSKHGNFYKNNCIFSDKAIEQSTSEQVAKVKVDFINIQPNTLICDLTGGMGAETIAFAERGFSLFYVELNKELFDISFFNFGNFELENAIQMKNVSAESFIENTKMHFELALLDPDRRAGGERDFTLENSSPNPLVMESTVLEKASLLWIKHSPLIDITFLRNEFMHCKSVQVFSFKNEVKEVCSLHANSAIDFREISCICIDYAGAFKQVDFEFSEMNSIIEVAEKCENYFFEPDKAIIKSGCANAYAIKNNFKSLTIGIPYYTSSILLPEMAGRMFRVIEEINFNERSFKKYLKANNISKASVSARGFVIKANEIEKKFGLKPSNDIYFFFYINKKREMRVVLCEQITQ